MDRGRILEEQGDLEAALVLVQAACGKSRAAMDAPYNNPANISQARMKHNSCVVGLRSLQRKISGEKGKDSGPRPLVIKASVAQSPSHNFSAEKQRRKTIFREIYFGFDEF